MTKQLRVISMALLGIFGSDKKNSVTFRREIKFISVSVNIRIYVAQTCDPPSMTFIYET
jgi:hypothetical protein